MCGISGSIGYKQNFISDMNEALNHRGPDDNGFFSEKSIQLGQTRLSILDLTKKGHQPMHNEDKSIWITYNGEIYNFQEIRKRLISTGHKFLSNTDTEVVIHAYEQFGTDCIKYFNGMFAFAIWDKNKNHLFAARDRLGIKPFIYYHNKDKFIFSSELKAILATNHANKKFNKRAIYDFFSYGSVYAPHTLIEKVYQLLPGHYLVFKNNGLKIDRYWKPSKNLSKEKEKIQLKKIRKLLEKSVKSRLISDVPLGAFLSGGIDSSAIVALMQKNSKKQVKTFSVVFNEKDYDESEFSDKIANKFNTDHKQILLKEKEVLEQMPKIFDSMDQPSVDGFNTYIISQAVKKAGLTVALSGLGGDELFAGYPLFKNLPRLNKLRKVFSIIPSKIRKSIFNNFLQKAENRRNLKTYAALLHCRNLTDLQSLQRKVFLDFEIKKIVEGNLHTKTQIKNYYLQNPINILSKLELSTYLQNTLLHDTDRMSMAHALEVRVPFLDHELVDYVLSIPGKRKVSKDYPKVLLLKAVKQLLPREVYKRKKQGFVFPWDKWLRNELKNYCDEKLSIETLKKIPFVNAKEVNRIWHSFLNGSELYNYSSILCFLSFVNWCEKNEIERGMNEK